MCTSAYYQLPQPKTSVSSSTSRSTQRVREQWVSPPPSSWVSLMAVVMTQIDRIEDISDNSWIDMLTGDADRFDGWSPKLGIYPVRLAGPKEIKAGIASSQMRAIEQRLFKSPEWVQISQKAGLGTRLGLPALRKNVLQLHQERISKWSVAHN